MCAKILGGKLAGVRKVFTMYFKSPFIDVTRQIGMCQSKCNKAITGECPAACQCSVILPMLAG